MNYRKILEKSRDILLAGKREAIETYDAAHIMVHIIEGKDVTPEQVEFLKAQSADIGKVLALIGLQAIPGSCVAIVALEVFAQKHGFSIFPTSQNKF